MTDRRLFFIGGATAAGKTTTARALSRELGAGWLQVDTVWLALKAAFPEGSPERTLLSLDEHARLESTTADELCAQHIAASRFICDALPAAIDHQRSTHRTLVVDGAWLVPAFVADIKRSDSAADGVFIHEPEAAEVKQAMKTRRGVSTTLPWQRRGAAAWWRYGEWLAAEARSAGLPIVAARPRETLQERVRAALRA